MTAESQAARTRPVTWDRVSGRVLDVVGALVGLLVLAPVLLLIALWVRLDSPGPVLFRQRRVGLRTSPSPSTSSARCGRAARTTPCTG